MPRQPRPSRLQAREAVLVVSSYGRTASIYPQGTSPLRAGNPLFFLKEIPMDRSLIKSMMPSLVAGHVPRNVRTYSYRVYDGLPQPSSLGFTFDPQPFDGTVVAANDHALVVNPKPNRFGVLTPPLGHPVPPQ